MTEDENQSMLVETFTSGNLLFVKGKVEKALRKTGSQRREDPCRAEAIVIPRSIPVSLIPGCGKRRRIGTDCLE